MVFYIAWVKLYFAGVKLYFAGVKWVLLFKIRVGQKNEKNEKVYLTN